MAHTHTSFTRATSEGVTLWQRVLLHNKVGRLLKTTDLRVNQTVSHAHFYTLFFETDIPYFFKHVSWNRDSAFSVFSTERALRRMSVCVCFPFRELTGGVERHSLCLVLTSLEFKHPTGILGCFSHHTTCDSHYTQHIFHTHTHILLHTLTPSWEHAESTRTHFYIHAHATQTMTQTFTGSRLLSTDVLAHTRVRDDVTCDVKTIWQPYWFIL